MEQTSWLTYRITFWRPWLLAITPLALLVALGVIPSLVSGKPAAAVGILLGFAGVAVALLLPIGLAISVSRWHIDSNGIGGRNNMLVYHRLDWSDIESVEPWLIPEYRYVQVNGVAKRRAFWLPLFLTDMPGFRAAIAQYAPAGIRCGAIWNNTQPGREYAWMHLPIALPIFPHCQRSISSA